VGAVVEITPSGIVTVLHGFCALEACPDGASPYAGLFQAADGDFYGTTTQGGKYGQGTVFRMTPSGKVTPIYNFCPQAGCSAGAYERVIEATDGNVYGTTLSAELMTLEPCFELRRAAPLPSYTASAPKTPALTAKLLPPRSFRAPVGSSSGLRTPAGLATTARSSACQWV
jgi:uncharacterized repeat protein (TIGR03803 family)